MEAHLELEELKAKGPYFQSYVRGRLLQQFLKGDSLDLAGALLECERGGPQELAEAASEVMEEWGKDGLAPAEGGAQFTPLV